MANSVCEAPPKISPVKTQFLQMNGSEAFARFDGRAKVTGADDCSGVIPIRDWRMRRPRLHLECPELASCERNIESRYGRRRQYARERRSAIRRARGLR